MMMKLLSVFLFLSLLVVSVSGCGLISSLKSHSAWTTEDSWYTGYPTEGAPYWTWTELDRLRIHEVAESKELLVEDLLLDVSVREISSEEAVELLGAKITEVQSTKSFLVRGVYLNRETGNFSVYVFEDQLLVRHVSMGRSAVPMKRQALVLQLSSTPTQVFVVCSMVE